MDNLLIIILIAFVVGVVLTGRRPRQQPQIIYVVAEPEPNSGRGCLLPLVVIGLVVFVVFGVG